MLHEVIARDHGVGVSLASILLDAGARTDVRDEFLKSTPLGWACRWGRVELVKLLLARGADPIEPEAEPWATPLAWAEQRQHAGIASILRQHGADRSLRSELTTSGPRRPLHERSGSAMVLVLTRSVSTNADEFRSPSGMGNPLAFRRSLQEACDTIRPREGVSSRRPYDVCVALPLRVYHKVPQAGAARGDRDLNGET